MILSSEMILSFNANLDFNNNFELTDELVNVDLLHDMVFEGLVLHVGC
jgi:hypothetical protein